MDFAGLFFYDRIKMVVGESCLRLRLRAAESSVHILRAFAIKVSNGGCELLNKKEDTWRGILGHYDAEFDTALRAFKGQWLRRFFAYF